MSPLEANTVHPRLRGELDLDAFCDYVSDGSSPLTRGTRSASSTRIRRKPVHPRLRGELGLSGKPGEHATGSSPLTRGTPKK